MEGSVRTPVHLWVVGGLSALWNAFGCFDYLMTQTHNEAWLSQVSEAARTYFDSFPAWLHAAWAFGVWGALAGSLLLLIRNRYAVHAFAVSLLGLLVSTIYQFFLSSPPPELHSGGMLAMNLAIWAVAIGLLLYAYRMKEQGILR